MKNKFGYWCPGGVTGEVEAETPIEAARKVLETTEVQFCHGSRYSQPWVYVGGARAQCKLWQRKTQERVWTVTLQGDPPTQIEVTTWTDSAVQREVVQEIKDNLKKLGHDPRLMIDWELAE